jgi:putative ABC transport system permease protein
MLWRKLMRDIRSTSMLMLAVAAIIAIGATCFIAMQSAYFNLRTAKDDYYRRCRMADFWLDMKRVPVTELPLLMDIPGIAQWHDRVQFPATVDLPDSSGPINARVISLPDRRRPVINDIVLRQGSYFTEQRRNEVIVSEGFAQYHGLRPGDLLPLVINRRRQELWVVGTAISAEFTYMLDAGSLIPDPQRFGVFYIKRSYAEDVFDSVAAANQVVGLLSPEGVVREAIVLRELERRLAEYGVFAAIPLRLQMSNQFLSNEINGLGAFATVTPVIFLITAALVLNVLLGRLARQQRTVVGTLKALGFDDRRLFLHFLTYGLLVGAAGGVAGSLLGYLAASGMTLVYRNFFAFPALPSTIYPQTHAIGLLVSLSFALLGSWRAAGRMLALRPAEAMRPEPPRSGGRVFVERWVPALWRQMSSGWRMVFRNVLRGRFRSVASAFSALAGSALLANGFMMLEAQNFLVCFQFEQVTRSDIDVGFNSEQGEEAWRDLQRMPGVQRVEPTLDLACTLVSGPYRRLSSVTGLLSQATLTVPHDRQGRPIDVPPSGLVLHQRLADQLHVRPGQTLILYPVKGERRPLQAVVARISDSYIGLSAYASIEYLSQLLGESLVLSGAQLRVDQRPQQLAAVYQELKRTPAIQSIQSRRDMIDTLKRTLLRNQWVFVGLLVLFAGAVFFGSVLNASFVNLQERRREVASLRAMGYTAGEIGSVFLREALLVNLAGTLLGLPAGYFLVVLTARAYDSDFFRLPVVWAPWIIAVTVALGALFTLLAHVLVQRAIQKLVIREALNVRE